MIKEMTEKWDGEKNGSSVFFPFHGDGFFRALFGAYATALAVFKVNYEIDTNGCIRAVQAAEAAFITFITVDHRLEGSPGAGLSRCSFPWSGDRQFCTHIFSSS
jgi:hypothetical protein